MIDFHDTVASKNWKVHAERCRSQKQAVHDFLKEHADVDFTGNELYRGPFDFMNITSVRRCLSDLADLPGSNIYRTGKVDESDGVENITYRYTENPTQEMVENTAKTIDVDDYKQLTKILGTMLNGIDLTKQKVRYRYRKTGEHIYRSLIISDL
ncbi:MAG: hypothetical protein KDC53_11965 [Saprospiraceae bacterium]|nr:hypothetical protein [Saprospiraceae bacterium]